MTERQCRPDEIRYTLENPGFATRRPIVLHEDRIPPAVSSVLGAWTMRWFPPRPTRIAILNDVIVAREGLVFTRDLTLIRETTTQHSPQSVSAARAAVQHQLAHGRMPRLTGTAVLCRKAGSANYGHFLVEILPKAWLARQLLQGDLTALVQVTGQEMAETMAAALACAGYRRDRIVATGPEPILVDQLVIVDGLSDHGGYMSPLIMDALDALTAFIQPSGPEKLLVLRRPASARSLDDQAAIVSLAEQCGFHTIIPDTLPWHRQVAAFKAARSIVGVMGAGLANLAFTAQGSNLTILAPATMPDTFYWFIAALRGISYVEIRTRLAPLYVGPQPWDHNLILDDEDRLRIFNPSWAQLLPTAPPNWRTCAAAFDALFDAEFYRACDPGIDAAGLDPKQHYLAQGWREGRDPAPQVSTARTVAAYPHIAADGICPMLYAILDKGADIETIKKL